MGSAHRWGVADLLRSIGISVAAGGPMSVTYGGQAVIEGVLMRSTSAYSIAARKPNGTIAVIRHELVSKASHHWLWKRPVFRGMATLGEMLLLGQRALAWSASVQLGEDVTIPPAAMGLTIAGSAVFAIGLFVVLPVVLASRTGVHASLEAALLEGCVRVLFLLGYLIAVSYIRGVRRVFEYHGAEHKAINGFESGADLSVENVVKASRLHPRCGTGFIVVVAVVTIILFAPLTFLAWWVRLGIEILLLPIVAGIAYEVIRGIARHRTSRLGRIALGPILGAQLLTTREPSPDQVEVAIAALDAVLPTETERLIP